MDSFNLFYFRELIRTGASKEELRKQIAIENQTLVAETGRSFDEEAEYAKIIKRKELYDQDHDITFTLLGRKCTYEAYLNGERLDIKRSHAVRLHSADFMWGYCGSGPAQLALAICLHLFGEDKAQEIYQDFKFRIIGALPQSNFLVTINIKTERNTIRSASILSSARPESK